MKERRRSPRFRIDQVIEIAIGKETYVQATGLNINQHGLLIRTEEELEPYTRLFLVLNLELTQGRKEIQCEGIVIRVEKGKDGYEIGLEFSDMDEEDRDFFLKFLASRAG